jgi:hypothetical protein
LKKLTIVNYKSIIAKESSYLLEESGVWLTPRFAIRSMANATLRYQEEEGRRRRKKEISPLLPCSLTTDH